MHDLIVEVLQERFDFDHTTPIHRAPRTGEMHGHVTLIEILGYLNPVWEILERAYNRHGLEPPEIYVVGSAANLSMTTHDIDIRYNERAFNPALEALFLDHLPDDLKPRVRNHFLLGLNAETGEPLPRIGNMIKLGTDFVFPEFEGLGIISTKESITEICPHVNKPEEGCVLAPYFEHLPGVYLQFLKVPDRAELRFPIECDHASEFVCPYVKFYFYSPEFEARAIPEVPIEEIAKRPLSEYTLQSHTIGERPKPRDPQRRGRTHGDLRVVWWDKEYRKLVDHARGFTLAYNDGFGSKFVGKLPQVDYEDKIIAIPKACPRVYWWEDVQGTPTLFTWEGTDGEFRHIGFQEGLDIFSGVPIKDVDWKTQEIMPLEWLGVEGLRPIGSPGSGAHVPGFLEIVERKKGACVIGCDEPNFKEFFFFGEKLRGRYVFRKVKLKKRLKRKGKIVELPEEVYQWIFWRTKDQGRFEELKELLGKQTGEFYSWAMPIETTEEAVHEGREGVMVYGEAIHSGPIGSIYLPEEQRATFKIYTEEELLKAGNTLKGVEIRFSPHKYLKPPGGPIIGKILEANSVKTSEGVKVPYQGFVWDSEAIRILRTEPKKAVSVGTLYIPRMSGLVDGFKLGGIGFNELVLLKPGEIPGDPKAYMEVLGKLGEEMYKDFNLA